MSPHQVAALLDRYVQGETTDQENELVERWLAENGTPNQEWQSLDQAGKEQWLTRLLSDITRTIHQPVGKIVPLAPRKRWVWHYGAAAAVVALIAFTLYQTWPLWPSRSHAVPLIALQVPINQKKQITLADGSRVWVNAGSAFRYPKTFRGKTREVYLSGEAYFDVQHDPAKPFLIHSGGVLTTVLGTAFNIKEDKRNHTVQVTVSRGKVRVANGRNVVGILTPNQQLSVNTLNAEALQETVNATAVSAWHQSELHFDDVSFGEATAQLQQRFQVSIQFRNANLKDCRFTGTSTKGEELTQILTVMCALNRATYQIQPDGSILIDGPGCTN